MLMYVIFQCMRGVFENVFVFVVACMRWEGVDNRRIVRWHKAHVVNVALTVTSFAS